MDRAELMPHPSFWGAEQLQILLLILSIKLHFQKKLHKLKVYFPKQHPNLCHSELAHCMAVQCSANNCWSDGVLQKLSCLPILRTQGEKWRMNPIGQCHWGKVQDLLTFKCSINVQNGLYYQRYPPAMGGWQNWDFSSGYASPYGVLYIYSVM